MQNNEYKILLLTGPAVHMILLYYAAYGRFEREEVGDYVLVVDSGYRLQKYLMTPFNDPETEGQNRYNESQIRKRNPVERSYGVWK